jgi:hypothetical protein
MSELLNVFDYGDIKEEHKEAAAEIINLLNQQGLGLVGEMIKVKFKLKEVPKYDPASSPFVAACAEAGVYCAIQGYIQEGVEPNLIQYPLMAICEDIRKFEKLIPIIKAMEEN